MKWLLAGGRKGLVLVLWFPETKFKWMHSQTKFCPLVRSQPWAGAGSGSVITRPTCSRVFAQPLLSFVIRVAAGSRGMPLAQAARCQAPCFAQGRKSEGKLEKPVLLHEAGRTRPAPLSRGPSSVSITRVPTEHVENVLWQHQRQRGAAGAAPGLGPRCGTRVRSGGQGDARRGRSQDARVPRVPSAPLPAGGSGDRKSVV